uniref:Uncharacterized protein n=1 Tax=Anguilla anguilla TaxID=7936 RepID=A0A0E9TBJ0_ANGAN
MYIIVLQVCEVHGKDRCQQLHGQYIHFILYNCMEKDKE